MAITGTWINPDDPDEEDCLIVEYTDEEQTYLMLVDGNGDMLEMQGATPDAWTQIYPVKP